MGNSLWGWFGLSYASWLTLPRVMMHDMPEDWQRRMAQLLEEYDEEFDNQPNIGTRVQCLDEQGKLTKTPHWLVNYRHPRREDLDCLRSLSAGGGNKDGT